jgi:hypothetical protein
VQAPVRCALVRRRAVRESQGSAEPPELLQPDSAVYLASAILLKPTAAMLASWVAFAGGGQHAAAACDAFAAGYPLAHHPPTRPAPPSPISPSSRRGCSRRIRVVNSVGVIGPPEGILPFVDMGLGKS